MARKFGKVTATLDQSQRWKSLPDDGCKLAYTWLLWCRHGNGIGLFQMPPMYLAFSLTEGDLGEAERRLDEIERAGLIDRAPDDVIRIRQWFTKEHSPRNPSIAIAVLKQFQDRSQLGDSPARTRAFLEFAYQVFTKVASWEDSRVHSALMAELPKEMEREAQRVPRLVQDALLNLGLDTLNPVWRTAWDMMSTPWEQEREQEQEREGERKPRGENPEQEHRTENREVRTRTENGEPRADPQEIIRGLTEKSRAMR